MLTSKKRKVPKGPKAQPGKVGRKASATKKSKPQGLDPSKPAYGIKLGGNQSEKKLRAKAASLFKTGSRNTPSAKKQLTGKAKRQVG